LGFGGTSESILKFGSIIQPYLREKNTRYSLDWKTDRLRFGLGAW